MSQDVSTYWLLRVNSVCHATARVCHHLVCQKDSNIELLTDLLNLAEHSAKNLLPISQLSSARVINSEWSDDRVNYHQRELILNHGRSRLHE